VWKIENRLSHAGEDKHQDKNYTYNKSFHRLPFFYLSFQEGKFVGGDTFSLELGLPTEHPRLYGMERFNPIDHIGSHPRILAPMPISTSARLMMTQ
jgi:hypothetical protein